MNVLKRKIQDIENEQDWKNFDEGQFEAITNTQDSTRLTNNILQRPIRMHSECMKIHNITWENTGEQRSAWERQIMSDKGHCECPINI